MSEGFMMMRMMFQPNIQGHGHYPGTGLQNNFGNVPNLYGGYNQWSQTRHVNENRSGSSDSFTGLLNEPEFKENPQPRPFTVLLTVLRVGDKD